MRRSPNQRERRHGVDCRCIADEWSIVLPVEAGMHQLLVSIDGEWKAPAGLPAAPDDFGQTIGVLRIES